MNKSYCERKKNKLTAFVERKKERVSVRERRVNNSTKKNENNDFLQSSVTLYNIFLFLPLVIIELCNNLIEIRFFD